MQTILTILKMAGGFRPNLYLKIENAPYMALVIEAIGTGPLGLPAISVTHYGEQNNNECYLQESMETGKEINLLRVRGIAMAVHPAPCETSRRRLHGCHIPGCVRCGNSYAPETVSIELREEGVEFAIP